MKHTDENVSQLRINLFLQRTHKNVENFLVLKVELKPSSSVKKYPVSAGDTYLKTFHRTVYVCKFIV
jgi:hypothetical protein